MSATNDLIDATAHGHQWQSMRDVDASSRPQDIKKHVWASAKTTFTEAQIIIIENSHRLPGDGTLDDVKVELLTGNDEGRRDFIPQAGGTP